MNFTDGDFAAEGGLKQRLNVAAIAARANERRDGAGEQKHSQRIDAVFDDAANNMAMRPCMSLWRRVG